MASNIEQPGHSIGRASRIIQAIDEIAFQTSLQALNTAIEAARAAEAGGAAQVNSLPAKVNAASRKQPRAMERTTPQSAAEARPAALETEGMAAHVRTLHDVLQSMRRLLLRAAGQEETSLQPAEPVHAVAADRRRRGAYAQPGRNTPRS
jgi:methyl-accepting chemotaxis protein